MLINRVTMKESYVNKLRVVRRSMRGSKGGFYPFFEVKESRGAWRVSSLLHETGRALPS